MNNDHGSQSMGIEEQFTIRSGVYLCGERWNIDFRGNLLWAMIKGEDEAKSLRDRFISIYRLGMNHGKPEATESIDEAYERVTEASQQPSKEELEEIAAREDAEWAKADQAERMAIAQRCEPTQEEIDMMGSAHQPYRCEDDLPADVFATVQNALAGRGTLTSLEQIALMKAMTAHGITLKRLEYPTPTAPYFALMLVSTHSRPARGWYLY